LERVRALEVMGLEDGFGRRDLKAAYDTRKRQLSTLVSTASSEEARFQHREQLAELDAAHRYLAKVLQEVEQSFDRPISTQTRYFGTGNEPATMFERIGVAPGEVFAGRYDVRRCLGAGSMSAVYAAYDRKRQIEVALKVMLPGLIPNDKARERLLREGRVASELSHRGIVKVFDVQCEGANYFLTMELLSGRTLREEMNERRSTGAPFRYQEALRVGEALSTALTFMHNYTVHRNVKPENVFFCDDGTIKLMDVGIPRPPGWTPPAIAGAAKENAHYVAPEQVRGERGLDGRPDQYSLAVVLYEMLTGQLPADAGQPLGNIRDDLPATFVAAIERARSPIPSGRFPTMEEFARALSEPAPKPAAAPPPPPPPVPDADAIVVSAPPPSALEKTVEMAIPPPPPPSVPPPPTPVYRPSPPRPIRTLGDDDMEYESEPYPNDRRPLSAPVKVVLAASMVVVAAAAIYASSQMWSRARGTDIDARTAEAGTERQNTGATPLTQLQTRTESRSQAEIAAAAGAGADAAAAPQKPAMNREELARLEAQAVEDARARAEALEKAMADAKAKAQVIAKAQEEARAKAEAEARAKAEIETRAAAEAKARIEARAKVEAEEARREQLAKASPPDRTGAGSSPQERAGATSPSPGRAGAAPVDEVAAAAATGRARLDSGTASARERDSYERDVAGDRERQVESDRYEREDADVGARERAQAERDRIEREDADLRARERARIERDRIEREDAEARARQRAQAERDREDAELRARRAQERERQDAEARARERAEDERARADERSRAAAEARGRSRTDADDLSRDRDDPRSAGSRREQLASVDPPRQYSSGGKPLLSTAYASIFTEPTDGKHGGGGWGACWRADPSAARECARAGCSKTSKSAAACQMTASTEPGGHCAVARAAGFGISTGACADTPGAAESAALGKCRDQLNRYYSDERGGCQIAWSTSR